MRPRAETDGRAWYWLWYPTLYPPGGDGEKAHLFSYGDPTSACGYAPAWRAAAPPTANQLRRCQLCTRVAARGVVLEMI